MILQRVASPLNHVGYPPIAGPEQRPDVLVQVSAVITKNMAAYDNDSWWDASNGTVSPRFRSRVAPGM